jgi:hypothetical protein
MAHDATFVAGIRQVRDDVLGLICDGNMLRSEISDQRWHQFDFEGYSCLECGQQPSGLLRIVQHQRALPQKSSDSLSMIGNMAQESHSRCVAAAFPGSHLGCGRPHCVAEVVGLELRNVGANYPFERSDKFPGSDRIPATEIIRV